MIHVAIAGREELWVEISAHGGKIRAIGPLDYLQEIDFWRAKINGRKVSEWPIPDGKTTAAILLRMAFLIARGEWVLPYKEDEICHCRAVPTHTVIGAIAAGAHDTLTVSRWTSASTACGTCRSDVESVLRYVLDCKK